MTLLLALTVAVLFATGVLLMLKRDLIRVVMGVILISNSASVYLMAAGLSRGEAPIFPLPGGTVISDPLVQALVLTALVIGFGTTALLLALLYRVYITHRSLDQEAISQAAEEGRIAMQAEEERV